MANSETFASSTLAESHLGNLVDSTGLKIDKDVFKHITALIRLGVNPIKIHTILKKVATKSTMPDSTNAKELLHTAKENQSREVEEIKKSAHSSVVTTSPVRSRKSHNLASFSKDKQAAGTPKG